MERAANPTALISYSHDSPEHEQRVLALCNRLRARGIDVMLDQFLPGAPAEGWPLWMERRIERSDFTLPVCTETYNRRFMADESGPTGRGVIWEARILRNLLYEDPAWSNRIVPLLLSPDARQFIPAVFREHFYDTSDARAFESLLHHLLREPGATPVDVGPLGSQGSRWSAFQRQWLVPDALRTRYFTGQATHLAALEESLTQRHRAAISGLGGAGKTQLAIEFAARHRDDYPDGVLWVNADSATAINNSFSEIASALQLSVASSSDQAQIASALVDWFNATDGWLLVLDNLDDRALLEPLLRIRSNGHVLITSREPAFHDFGIPHPVRLEDFAQADSVQFLLKRSGREQTGGDEHARAAELAEELGHLPLALEQAAAYVAETGARFADYLSAFRKRRVALLERSGALPAHDTVAVTWSANLQAVENASPAAAQILRLSAFLGADAIPFEILLSGAPALGDPIASALRDADDLTIAEVLRPLARYSLLRVNAEARAYSVHRLVQLVTRSALAEAVAKKFVESAVLAIDAAFPEVDYVTWAQCDRLLGHATVLASFVDAHQVRTPAAARLLWLSGKYLSARSRYDEARALIERAVEIEADRSTLDNDRLASVLTDLGWTNWHQGRNAEAETHGRRAVAIREALGSGKDLALSLNLLGSTHWRQGRYAEALTVLERALALREAEGNADEPGLALLLNDIANIHIELGRFNKALNFYERALAMQKRVLPPGHPALALCTSNIGNALMFAGSYAEAEPFLQQALRDFERAYGPDHWGVAQTLTNLATLALNEERYAEMRPLYERALEIDRVTYGERSTEFATDLYNLGQLAAREGDSSRAETQLKSALELWEVSLGPQHAYVAYPLLELADIYRKRERWSEAGEALDRADVILDAARGPEHPDMCYVLIARGALHRSLGNVVDARECFERALAIRERALGEDHPETLDSLLLLIPLLDDERRGAGLIARLEQKLKAQARTDPASQRRRATLDALRGAEPAGSP